MPIDKALNEMPSEGELKIEIDAQEMPEIEVVLEEDGSAVVEIGEDEADEVGFYDNLAEVIEMDERQSIALELQALFEADKSSRQDWEMMYAKGLELLGLKIEERTKPFRGAAGSVHPMLTEAIIQFQAQALKELMPAGGPVRSQIVGKETLEKAQQAARVQDFMNYQITTVMKEYTPEFDQLLFYTGYGGSTFKKVYYDAQVGRMVSKLCLADDVFIPYWGSSVMSECPRITHRIAMNTNDFRKRVVAGEYLDLDVQPAESPADASQITYSVDKQTGVVETGAPEEIFLLEFHVDLDIPGFEDIGEDGEPTGIKLPYVVTIDETSGKVLAIRRNWIEGDNKCCRRQYFVHYVLVEGLGAYGLGFVHLIGSLSKTATMAMRQLLDAGTLSNLPAGFKAKGARISDDDNPIQPGEWRDMDAGGAELSSSLMPLPYKEPSQTLFQLLGFTVDAGKRLASIADMQVGDANQMAAVGTTLALLERGSMVMSAIHKRLHYAQKLEFELLAKGFAEYLPDEYPYSVPGADRSIKKKDFNDLVAVLPVADPNIFSAAQRITLAQTQLQLAQSAPQMHNLYEAYYRVYQAMNVRDIDGILRPQSNQMPKDPASENADPMAAMELQKHILSHVRLKAEEAVEVELFKAYGTDPDRMVSAIQKEGMVAIKCAQFMQEARDLQNQLMGAGQPDPVVQLKEQELQQRAAKDQADIAAKQQQQQIDREKISANSQANQARIASQENIANLRADVARERVDVMLEQQRRNQNAA